jgi:glycosyltransferase involved in cell wall biosynthesis
VNAVCDASGPRRATVLVAYKSLPRYRIDFFSALRLRLRREHVELVLAHGEPHGADAYKRDTGELSWAAKRSNRTIRFGHRHVVWQPCLDLARRADLVIVEQASRLLVNYVLLAMQSLRLTRVAFWGHGANLQHHRASRLGEHLKRIVSRHPHWWFAYTEGTRERVAALGFPSDRITVVQNAVDTTSLRAQIGSVTESEVLAWKERNRIARGPVGLFLGSLYAEKRLPFLFAAADRIRKFVPDFQLVIGGDGLLRREVREQCARRNWATYLGSVYGADKAVALAAADVFLMPGLVGLAVLDSFAAGLPIATTAVDFHSPEIEYVEDGLNGVVTPDPEDVGAYALAVKRVLSEHEFRHSLQIGCRRSAERYTNEAMVERFTEGVLRALGRGVTS